MSSDTVVYERYKHIPENVWQREGESDEAWFQRINPNGPPLRDISVKFLRGQGVCESVEVWKKKFHERLDQRIRRKRSSQAQAAPPTSTDTANSTPPAQARENVLRISSAAVAIGRSLENAIPISVSRPTLVERPVSPPTSADNSTLETAPALSASSSASALPVTLDFATRGSAEVSEESIVKAVQSMIQELLVSKVSEISRLSEEKALLAHMHNETWTELENTRRQLSRATSCVGKQTAEIQEKNQQISRVIRKWTEVESQMKALQHKEEEMQITLVETNTELGEVKQEIVRLRDLVKESNGEKDELKAEVKGLKVLLENSQNDNEKLRDESARRQEEADAMVQDIGNSVGRFNKDLDEMKKRFRVCQEEATTLGLVKRRKMN